jgi:DNA-binding NarL/FixJ family response regulator
MSPHLNILLLDPEPLTRFALAEMISRMGRMRVISQTNNLANCIQQTEKLWPDVVLARERHPLVDIQQLARALSARGFKNLVCISEEGRPVYLRHLIDLGVAGLLTAACPSRELKSSLESVAKGHSYASPAVARALIHDPVRPQGLPIERLSPRELQVLRLVCAGLSAKEIATKLGLSPKTVSTYRYRIRLKLSLKHSAELITAGLRMQDKGLLARPIHESSR